MLKQIIICVALFRMLNAIPQDSSECSQDPVKLDSPFLMCCRGKPTFTSENCVDELMKSNYTITSECMVDCMYKDFKFYNGTHIDLTDVKTFFQENVNEQDVRDLFINAFEACDKMEPEKLQLFSSVEVENDTIDCDMFPFYMDQCVWYHTLSHCPERLAGGEEEQCQIKAKWVKQCLLN